MSELKKISKINDVKKVSTRKVIPLSGSQKPDTFLPKKSSVTISSSLDSVKQKEADSSESQYPIKKRSFKIFQSFFKKAVLRIFLVVIAGLTVYFASEFLYHGTVVVQVRKQVLDNNIKISIVPNVQFSNSQGTLPYYVYVSDRVVTPEALVQEKDYLMSLLQIKLPQDAVLAPEYMFITNQEESRLSTIFFKKTDIVFFLEHNKIDTTYRNKITDIKNLAITLDTPIGNTPTGGILSATLLGDFVAKGILSEPQIISSITGSDTHSCTQILQGIPEITVDKCHIFPPWYKNLPKNSTFIRLIVK